MDKIKQVTNIAFDIGELAVEAMLFEVACYPSSGLVSPVSSGAHDDMNFFTFLKSTSALSKYMILFAQEGYSEKKPKEIFNSIRKIGIEAEKQMYEKTDGINTHKGMLFLMGISCAAAAKTIYEKKDFSFIKEIIKEMTEGIVAKELHNLNENENLTHGEKLFLKYKAEGIRGEAQKGLPLVFEYALDIYNENKDLDDNDRLIHTLVAIMEKCEDTTVLHRHSMEVLLEVQNKVKHIMQLGGMTTEEGKCQIIELDQEFIERRISPGGCADLLAATVFFSLVQKLMERRNQKN